MEHRRSHPLLSQGITPILTWLTMVCSAIVLMGIVLDHAHRLGAKTPWQWLGLLILFSLLRTVWHTWHRQKSSVSQLLSALLRTVRGANPAERIFMVTTLLILGVNLILCAVLYPYNTDSVTYLLPRSLYFIQHQSTDFFDANYWAQVTHPFYGAYLNIAAWQMVGTETAVNFIQYLGGCGGALAMFGIALWLSDRLLPSLLAACVFLNLTIVNLQMTTTQVELIMGALLAGSVYFGLCWVERRTWTLAGLAALCFGLALGMKSSALLYVPALVVLLAGYEVRSPHPRRPWALGGIVVMVLTVVLLVFATAGYGQNLHYFGNPIGPKLVYTEHSLHSVSLSQRLQLGAVNMVRYTSQLLSLDGLPAVKGIHTIHSGLQRLFVLPFQQLGLPINATDGVRSPFLIDQPLAQEDTSYWGVLGLLILPAVGLAWRQHPRPLAPFALSFVTFLTTQALIAQYDPWRGRYFIAGAVFAVPLVVNWWRLPPQPAWRQRTIAIAVACILLTASVSSLTTLLYREAYPLIATPHSLPPRPSVFHLNRLEQLTRGDRPLAASLGRVTRWLETHPQQTLYTVLPESYPEYPLFRGQTVVPLNGFVAGFDPQHLTELEAGLLLYHDTIYTDHQRRDRSFGHHLWGRVVTGEER